jgi:hypothetical protein
LLLAQDDEVCRSIYFVCGFFDFDGSAGRCDVGAGFGDCGRGFFVEVADELGGFADAAHAVGVGGGEEEAVEEGVGALFGDAVGGEGVDNAGDGDLDGGGVLEREELDVVAHFDAVRIEVGLVAVGIVGALKAVVEVTEDGCFEGYGAALEAGGFDVAAEVDLHEVLRGCPPGGGG